MALARRDGKPGFLRPGCRGGRVQSYFDLLMLWGPLMLKGALVTLLVAILSFGLGFTLGVLGASAKLYGGIVLRTLMNDYTSIMRAVPELVLLLLLYFAFSDLMNFFLGKIGIGPININGVVAGVSVLGIVQGAYSTEVIRGAIQAIPYGQLEAAAAYGMSPWQRRWSCPSTLRASRQISRLCGQSLLSEHCNICP